MIPPQPMAGPRVEQIRSLLGDQVLLLPWERGSKGTKKRWKHLTQAAMRDPAHLRALEAGNIGVAHGKASAGLCTIDIDEDATLEAFLNLNPTLRVTLQTRGQRGGNLWVRCAGDYPSSRKLRAPGVGYVGEWRADGNQTIISGLHPTGCAYQIIHEAPPLTIEFSDLVWSPLFSPPRARAFLSRIEHRDSESQKLRNAEPQVVSAPPAGESSSLFDPSEYVPTDRGQSDRLLFQMARRVKRWEREVGRKSSGAERERVFQDWWDAAQGAVDPSKGRLEYLGKFLYACDAARLADDESFLDLAWREAERGQLPAEAARFVESAWMPKLVAFCFQLQKLRGPEPFFLSYRDAARRVGQPLSSVVAAFSLFCNGANPILRKVSSGRLANRTANEYLYLPLVEADRLERGAKNPTESIPQGR